MGDAITFSVSDNRFEIKNGKLHVKLGEASTESSRTLNSPSPAPDEGG